jgi:hypothetical protein
VLGLSHACSLLLQSFALCRASLVALGLSHACSLLL